MLETPPGINEALDSLAAKAPGMAAMLGDYIRMRQHLANVARRDTLAAVVRVLEDYRATLPPEQRTGFVEVVKNMKESKPA